jgi:uncharacterized delta-60 repeat protein
MSISRPFAYNPTFQTEGVSEQFGPLSVGFSGQSYDGMPGGLKWWEGPDEELGYVIGTSLPSGGVLGPDGIYGDVTFWRTASLSEPQFITLTNKVTGNNFSTVNQCVTWLNANGYWTSISPILSNPIIVVGWFDTFSGLTSGGIVKLNSDGSNDTNFVTGTGFAGGNVNNSLIQSDGKIIVGGYFTSYSGISSNRIARLNTNGSYDSTFTIGSGFDDFVYRSIFQPDGKIIVCGDFTQYSGITSGGITRLNPNGSYDSTFNVGTGFDRAVITTQVQSDGKILVGGQFNTYSGTSVNRFVRLTTNGNLDFSFDSTGPTYTSLIQPDGKIIIGGEGDGSLRNTPKIRRFNVDGTIDSSFSVGSGFNNTIWGSAIQANGKIIVGGYFSSFYPSTNSQGIISLNDDGTIDSTFSVGTGFTSTVHDASIQTDGKIICVGDFTSYSGISSNRIARLNTDGSYDSTFNIGTGFDSRVYSTKIQSDGKILVGGQFTSYSGRSFNRITRLNTNGFIDSTFSIGDGFTGLITNISIQNDEKIIVGGGFTSFSGISSNAIARLNTNGSYDSTFNIGTGFTQFSQVWTIQIQSDNKILVGGTFSSYSGISCNRIARLNTNGSFDSTFNIGTGFNNSVLTSALQSDGKIIVGGNFTSYSGISCNRIARLNTDGSYDSTFNIGTGFNSTIWGLSIQSDGKILVGGFFTLYNGIQLSGVIRLNTDGSIDSTLEMGSGFNNVVYKTLQREDDTTLVLGSFSAYSGIPCNRIARLNTDGSYDSTFTIETGLSGNVETILIRPNGKIFVGGYETTSPATGKVSLLNPDGSLDNSFNTGGFNDLVHFISNYDT